MAYLLLYNSDQAKYRSLLTGLRSQYSLENDQYPKSVNSATDILSNHRHDNQNKQRGSSEYVMKRENNIDKDDKNITLHQTAIAAERQLTRVPIVLKNIPVQETNGLLNVQSSICKQKRTIEMMMKIRAWIRMLLA